MKAFFLLALTLFSTASFAALECKYQVMARYSDSTQEFDIDVQDEVTLLADKRLLIDVKGNNSKKEYMILLETRNMTNGTSLTFSVYENFKLDGTGFTGKPVSSTLGLFGKDQLELQLQSVGPDLTVTNIFCTQN